MFILFENETKERAIVTYQHSNPKILPEDLLKKGVIVDDMPIAQSVEGKIGKLYFNPINKEMWYEYESVPKTEMELLREDNENLRASQAEQDALIMELMIGGTL